MKSSYFSKPHSLSQEIYHEGSFNWKPDLENFNSSVSDLSMLFRNEQEMRHQSRPNFQFRACSCIEKPNSGGTVKL